MSVHNAAHQPAPTELAVRGVDIAGLNVKGDRCVHFCFYCPLLVEHKIVNRLASDTTWVAPQKGVELLTLGTITQKLVNGPKRINEASGHGGCGL
jgi:hypothetical protein